MTAFDLSVLDFLLVALAAVAGGLVNAVAGGGTLITFPILTAVGLPAVSANVTNTVALCPGYLGGTFAQAADLRGQERRLWLLIPAGVIGGILGGILLLSTGERVFRELVPYLILLASGLLAAQPYLRAWLIRYQKQAGHKSTSESWSVAPVTLAAIYGGYFGAGLGVITLAVLGLVLEDTLTRLNGLKQALSLAINVAAALFFVFSDQVVWPVALVMAVGALAGGALGGRLAGRLNPAVLRWLVVTIGVVVAIIYLVR
jgi:uncharacterized membrane protein YfcA